MEPEDQLLVFRDINGLLDASGVMSQGADLVDKANDKVVKMRFRTKAQQADEAAGESAAGGEGEGEGIDEEIEGNADDGSPDGGDDDAFAEANGEEKRGKES